jgi:hypothetical protein
MGSTVNAQLADVGSAEVEGDRTRLIGVENELRPARPGRRNDALGDGIAPELVVNGSSASDLIRGSRTDPLLRVLGRRAPG